MTRKECLDACDAWSTPIAMDTAAKAQLATLLRIEALLIEQAKAVVAKPAPAPKPAAKPTPKVTTKRTASK